MKSGIVVVIGRPNVGKSTLINAIIGQKVVITSPKPQTTRLPIEAVYEDEHGQIIFTDTPGIYARANNPDATAANQQSAEALPDADLVLYVIDPTRQRSTEENKTLGMVRAIKAPKILVINKLDIKKPSYIEQYAFMEEEFVSVIRVSGATRANLNRLVDAIFEYLPHRDKIVDMSGRPTPLLNMDAKTFVAEIIREKIYLQMQKEVPYTVTVVVDEITHRSANLIFIRARIITTADRYKKILIGAAGKQVKEFGIMARKELETATGKKIYLDLQVDTR